MNLIVVFAVLAVLLMIFAWEGRTMMVEISPQADPPAHLQG
jgi:hypothetical protein